MLQPLINALILLLNLQNIWLLYEQDNPKYEDIQQQQMFSYMLTKHNTYQTRFLKIGGSVV